MRALIQRVSEARLVQFAPDAYWRGETHRLTDRPASIGRLLEEAAAAGVSDRVLVLPEGVTKLF